MVLYWIYGMIIQYELLNMATCIFVCISIDSVNTKKNYNVNMTAWQHLLFHMVQRTDRWYMLQYTLMIFTHLNWHYQFQSNKILCGMRIVMSTEKNIFIRLNSFPCFFFRQIIFVKWINFQICKMSPKKSLPFQR